MGGAHSPSLCRCCCSRSPLARPGLDREDPAVVRDTRGVAGSRKAGGRHSTCVHGADRRYRGGRDTTPTLTPYDEVLERYDPVLGLETHVELGTATKLFCGCSTEFGADPNTQVCPVCLGLPGSLPVTNEKAIEFTVRIGLALNCASRRGAGSRARTTSIRTCRRTTRSRSTTSRSASTAISTSSVDGDDLPGRDRARASRGGHRQVAARRRVDRTDPWRDALAGRLQPRRHPARRDRHEARRRHRPRAAAVARAYVTELRDLLRGLGVSDVRMEQGSLRCDVNLSLMPKGSEEFGTRTETKNVNSLRSVERAVRYEVERQGALLDAGERIVQETRHFHEDTGTTSPGRSKEEAQDYRYFPEPDLVPLAPSVRGRRAHPGRGRLRCAQ